MALARFQTRVLLRGRAALVAAGVFALAAGLTAVLGLDSFRQVGLGAVGPAAAAIVNLAILLPTAKAILLGALGLSGDRESGFAALLRARGVGAGSLVVATWGAVTAAAWLALGLGFGMASLVLQAGLGAVATWFLLAIGLDLVVLGLGAFVHLGEGAILVAVAADPFTSGRIAALLLLDAGGGVLGSVGQYLVLRVGAPAAAALLVAIVCAWVAVPLLLASRIVSRRDA